ncbi:nucleotidyltransferase domain-containing protein [candidate division KSB1 bacterium]|nr:nucleotidyltransferase domain-containing protein [candidate division KSB1 bacterium]
MIDKNKIVSEIKAYLNQNFGPSVRQVILFGSHVKDLDKPYSDFDVLIVLDKDYSWQDENRILDLCYDIDLKYDILIDAHLLSDRELSSQRGRQPFIENAFKNGLAA